MIVACPDCGSTEVHCTAWVHANTDEVLNEEPPLEDYYCTVCEEHFKYADHLEPFEYSVQLGSTTVLIEARSPLEAARELLEAHYAELLNTLEVSVRRNDNAKEFEHTEELTMKVSFVRVE